MRNAIRILFHPVVFGLCGAILLLISHYWYPYEPNYLALAVVAWAIGVGLNYAFNSENDRVERTDDTTN